MPEETISDEEFSHYHHNGMNAFKGVKGEKADVTTDGKLNLVKEALQNDFEHLLDDILKDLSPTGTPDPKAILNKALVGLSKVEERRFVLQNLLEAIKAADGNINVTQTLQRYKDLGLTTIEFDPSKTEQYQIDGTNTKGFGKFLLDLLKKAAKMGLTLMEIIKNAAKKVFGSVGIKPIIGVTGAFPSISFQLEVENLTAAEFFEAIRASI
jgi:hypothetical protein